MKRSTPAKRHTYRGKAEKPSHVTPPELSSRKQWSEKTFSIASDKGGEVTASEVFGEIVIYEGRNKPRKATPSEVKRYVKAVRRAEKEFFKE